MLALISFDAPSIVLLDRVCGEGRLPRLAELRASGRTVPLSTSASRFPAVDPAHAPALVAEIREGLESFTLESGAPAVAGVHDTSAVAGAAGHPSDLLPDLVVSWADEPSRRGERLVSPRFGSVRRAEAGSGRWGNHTDDAWALVVPGRGRMRPLERADIGDIAATALARFGVAHAGESLLGTA